MAAGKTPPDDDFISFLAKDKSFADQIIDNSRSMISIINRDYIYEKVNIPFCKAQKTVADAILGRTLADVWGEETFKKHIKQNIDRCFSGDTVKYEATFTTPCAGQRFYEVVFRPFTVDSGKISHLLAETFDITDIKMSEKIATEKEEEFRRIEQMLEDRLLQAQKLETIGSLAGGLAHDFNNILATISGYSELLQEDMAKSSSSFQKVKKIQIAVSKARSLVNQMLTFSRQVEQEKVIVKVNDVLKETIGFIKSAAPGNVTVRSRIPKKNAPVYADPTQLFRIFLNLLTNAIQALEERKGTISVNLSCLSGKKVQARLDKKIVADEYALITITDTGKGMDPSLLRRIFEPFFTTREVGKGSGMGLSVVYGIVTEIGGEVLVSSVKGKGSVFYVYLPLTSGTNGSSHEPGSRKKILFIMGNRHESNILSLALESAGYELIKCPVIKDLAKVMSGLDVSPDLVIYMTDAGSVSAEEFMRLLKAEKNTIQCILIDDPEVDFNEEKFVNSGIKCQHLMKPVSLKEIKSAIHMSLR
ncbi:MAG TPA: ATP-binding protein [Bacteroidales bacterium]|nr:ATP-binding protein [Bacteroidales bacterium]